MLYNGNSVEFQADWVTLNYVPFGEKCLTMTVNLYAKTCNEPIVNHSQVLMSFIRVRNSCPLFPFISFYLQDCVYVFH